MKATDVKTVVTDSNVKVSLPVETKKPVFVERRLPCQTIAAELASRITGKMIGFDDLFDPKTNTFLTETELVAKGAVFVTVSKTRFLAKVIGLRKVA